MKIILLPQESKAAIPLENLFGGIAASPHGQSYFMEFIKCLRDGYFKRVKNGLTLFQVIKSSKKLYKRRFRRKLGCVDIVYKWKEYFEYDFISRGKVIS